MGAASFGFVAEGYSAVEIFEKECQEAIYEYGNDIYNGTISTTELRKGLTFDKFNKKNFEAAKKYAEERCDKRETMVFDFGIVSYETYKVVRTKLKPTAKYKQEYVIYYISDFDKKITSFDTFEKANEYCMMHHHKKLEIRKEPVKVSGSSLVASYVTKTKITKTKPKNTNVREIHKYWFYGLAAE